MRCKKGELKSFLIIAIPLVLIGIIVSLLYISSMVEENHPIRKIVDGMGDIFLGDNSGKPEDEIMPPPNFTFSVSGGGSSGGSGGSGGESSGGTSSSSDCEKDLLSFGLLEPEENFNCLEFYATVCIEKEVNCSIQIRNSDNVSGFFPVKIDVVSQGYVIDSSSRIFSLGPKEVDYFNYNSVISSTGENDPANLDLRCLFSVIEEPYSC